MTPSLYEPLERDLKDLSERERKRERGREGGRRHLLTLRED